MNTFFKQIQDHHLIQIAQNILKSEFKQVDLFQVCLQYGENEEDVRYYDVFKLVSNKTYILKKTSLQEVNIYETYLTTYAFHTPTYYGCLRDQSGSYILIDYIDGTDVSIMDDETILKIAEILGEIACTTWQSSNQTRDPRMNQYLSRIEKRYQAIQEDPQLKSAYQIFLKRQQEIPTTLSHGDFLPWNIYQKDNEVYLLDWGFSGRMPYALDVARLISHATSNQSLFPFYMSDIQKEIFLKAYYQAIHPYINKDQFEFDILLARLNEYVEFVEANEDQDGSYLHLAYQTATKILNKKSNHS